MNKYRKGDIVEIEFWDHTAGTEPYLFRAWGRIKAVTKLAYVVQSWAFPDIDHEDEDNVEQSTILRSTIQKMHKLRKKR